MSAASVGEGELAACVRLELRLRRSAAAATRPAAPTAKIAGRPPERGRVAVDRGLGGEVGGRCRARRRSCVAALAASVLSSAVPIEPPICWLVLTIAEATPASRRSTPSVAVLIAGRHDQAEAEAHDQQARAGRASA